MGVGLVGVGKMGTAIWLRLHDQGIDPIVFDVRPEATASLARLGAAVAPDAAALASEVDIVLLSLPTSIEVEDVAIGPGGLVEGAGSTTLVVDLTSGLPSASRRIAAALVCKDFDIALRVAAEEGVAVPLAAAAQQAARLALAAAPAGADLIDEVAVWEGLAGVALGADATEGTSP